LFANLDEVSEFRPWFYCRPRSKTFTSVDSFAILPAKLFDPASNDEWAIVGFQVTVSSAHKVNGSGLKRVVDHVEGLRPAVQAPAASLRPSRIQRPAQQPPPLPIYLVFIGDHNALKDKQEIVRDDSAEMTRDLNDIKQFSLTLDQDFQKLLWWHLAE
jgi:hypothetical protein